MFSPFLKTKEDITQLFENQHVQDEVLHDFLVDLFDNPTFEVSRETLTYCKCLSSCTFWPLVIALPDALRERPVINQIKMTRPFFDIDVSGIVVNDCPGTQENSHYNHLARNALRHSSIVIYVFKVGTPLTSHDEDIKVLKLYMKFGKQVIFLLNEYDDDKPDSIETTIKSLNHAFNDMPALNIFRWNVLRSPQVPSPFAKVNKSIMKWHSSSSTFANSLRHLQDPVWISFCDPTFK